MLAAALGGDGVERHDEQPFPSAIALERPTTVVALMARSMARWPEEPAGGDGVPPADIYKVAVDEYRFQAQYNWSRTQYLLALNVGILTAGAAVASQGGGGAAPVFLLGVVAAVLSGVAVRTQHDYYRAARDRMRRVEEALRVPKNQQMDTTSTLGQRPRFVSVNRVVYLLLAAIAAANVVGLGILLER